MEWPLFQVSILILLMLVSSKVHGQNRQANMPDSIGLSIEVPEQITALDLLLPGYSGRDSVELEFIFFVEPSGEVSEVYAFPNPYPELEADVINEIKSWDFGPSPEMTRQKIKVAVRVAPQE